MFYLPDLIHDISEIEILKKLKTIIQEKLVLHFLNQKYNMYQINAVSTNVNQLELHHAENSDIIFFFRKWIDQLIMFCGDWLKTHVFTRWEMW